MPELPTLTRQTYLLLAGAVLAGALLGFLLEPKLKPCGCHDEEPA